MDSLVGTIRDAKTERRKLRDLIEKAGPLLASSGQSREDEGEPETRQPEPTQSNEKSPVPISWPDTGGRVDITAVARKQGRSRSEVALAERLGRTMASKKRATG
ncbi:MAG: hypothetical protein R3A46_03040 [Thermomicrobiales bacterium]